MHMVNYIEGLHRGHGGVFYLLLGLIEQLNDKKN